MTPNFAVVGIDAPGIHWPRIWLPVFLLWVPALVLAPLVLVVLAVACWLGRVGFWATVTVLWRILCSLPGTDVRVRAAESRVVVRIV
jgi:hypothetical protein